MPDLQGLRVVVTRPQHQAAGLQKTIEIAGAQVLLFPVLAIAEPRAMEPLLDIINRLSEFDIAVFISPNAVDFGLGLVLSHTALPPFLLLAAVGAGTAKAMEELGHRPDIFPATAFNSEALLEMEEMQHVAGKKVVIFRGEGGRELLANTLRERGAEVEYAECYRREKPHTDVNLLLDAWSREAVDAVVVTSNEGLQNLYDMVGPQGQHYLKDTQLILVSTRAAELAHTLGIRPPVIVASRPSDDAIVVALKDWWHARSN